MDIVVLSLACVFAIVGISGLSSYDYTIRNVCAKPQPPHLFTPPLLYPNLLHLSSSTPPLLYPNLLPLSSSTPPVTPPHTPPRLR